MTITTVSNVSISGLVSVLPDIEVRNIDNSGDVACADMQKIVNSTGIKARRIVSDEQTALSMATKACDELLNDLSWSREDVCLLIVVTQTPDNPLPGNAIKLQHILGLSKSTIAFDVNLGCSGFVYGAWQVAQLMNGLSGSKALLVVGDTTSRQYSGNNRNVAPLFGDAVSAIAFEKKTGCDDMVFSFGSDGAGAPYLIQPFGGALNPTAPRELFMDGMQVFVFTLREIPKSIDACLQAKQWTVKQLDYCIMHQANEMMLKRLGDKVGVTPEQNVIAMSHVGNTSSASIPLALSSNLNDALTTKSSRLLMSGFGVGWSWGTMAVELSPLSVCKTIEMNDN